MTKIIALSLAALALGTVAAPASAQVAGIATADPTVAIYQSKAFIAANQQIQTTYKSQLDQITARNTALEAQLKTFVPAIDSNKDGRVSQDEFDAATAAKVPAAAQWAAAQQAADQQNGALFAPIARAQAYAIEMIINAYPAAQTKVITDKKITVILTQGSLVYAPEAADVTAAIAAEIDKTTPTVSIAAPATWQPQQQTLQVQQALQQLSAMSARMRAAQGGAGGAGAPPPPKPGDAGR